MSYLGLRVVRGPGWKSRDEDGGEGGVGTVASEVDPAVSITEQDYRLEGDLISNKYLNTKKRYVVLWDCGLEGTYTVHPPFDKKPAELRVLDNSCLGVSHRVECNGPNCYNNKIDGIRWECAELGCGTNFCVYCFLQVREHHDPKHLYFRNYQHPVSTGDKIEGISSKLIPLKGIYVGSKVKRGINWNFGDEDGNPTIGEVIDPPLGMKFGQVLVRWANGNSFPYRRGLNGKTDLVAVEPTTIGLYQPDALPACTTLSFVGFFSALSFSNYVQDYSDHHSSAVDVKEELIVPIMRQQDAELEKSRQSLHRLQIKETLQQDKVPTDDDNKVGKAGALSSNIYGARIYATTPAPLEDSRQCHSNNGKDTEARDEGTGNGDGRRGIKRQMSTRINESGSSSKIVRSKQFDPNQAFPLTFQKGYILKANFSIHFVQAAYDGDLARMQKYFERGECLVNGCTVSGVNALHAACRKRDVHIIEWLLKNGADLESCDRKGRSAIYFGVKGRVAELLKFLINKKAELNDVLYSWKKRWSPLRKAVEMNCVDCVKVLVAQEHCNVNLQDYDGVTALHKAIEKTRTSSQLSEMVVALVSSGRVNWELKDEVGLTVFHRAVRLGNCCTIEYLLDKGGIKLITQRISGSNFSALHYVCFHQDVKTAELLIHHVKKVLAQQQRIQREIPFVGQSTSSSSATQEQLWSPDILIDLKTEEGMTSLMFACLKCNYALVELLVEAGANIFTTDNNGNSTFINVTRESRLNNSMPSLQSSPEIFQLFELYKRYEVMYTYPRLAIICYLIKKGYFDFNAANNEGKTAIQFLTDDSSMRMKISSFLEDLCCMLCM